MALDLSVENKFNFWLILGTINHTIFLAVIFFGYVASDFQLHGDNFGGVMMVYALSIFIPQIIFEIFVFAALIITLLIYVMRSEIIETSKILVISFISTLLFVIITVSAI